jgi:serine/threonine-protein kinase RsbW
MKIPKDTPDDALREARDAAGTGSAQPPAASPLPLWWWRSFPGEPSQVSQARSWVARLLPACGPLDDLLIFTSELAANAVTHTRSGQPGGWFTVEVTWTPRRARVIVGDQGSDEVPAPAAIGGDHDAFLESGRGLLLIDMMSAAWGITGDDDARWLWADADWRSPGGPLPDASVGSNPAETQCAAIRYACPGASAWYSEPSREWRASLPGTPDATLSAPSPLALTCLLAARDPGDPRRAMATPVT